MRGVQRRNTDNGGATAASVQTYVRRWYFLFDKTSMIQRGKVTAAYGSSRVAVLTCVGGAVVAIGPGRGRGGRGGKTNMADADDGVTVYAV